MLVLFNCQASSNNRRRFRQRIRMSLCRLENFAVSPLSIPVARWACALAFNCKKVSEISILLSFSAFSPIQGNGGMLKTTNMT